MPAVCCIQYAGIPLLLYAASAYSCESAFFIHKIMHTVRRGTARDGAFPTSAKKHVFNFDFTLILPILGIITRISGVSR